MSTSFDPVHFAEGRFRRAYKGTYIKPRHKRGMKCVVKEMKDNYTWAKSDWESTIKIYNRARKIATQFNERTSPYYPITITNVQVQYVISASSYSGPSLNEYVIVEDYLEGTFRKWCNNYGYISYNAKTVNITLPAFAHWSWVYTGGREMVCDLQGVKDDNGYHLTDPVVLSLSRTYGQTDTGIEGMAMFFLNHKCNDICRGWIRPSLYDFKGKIPQATLSACRAMQSQVNNATTFNFELKFPPRIKQIVTGVFLEIAQS